MRGEEAKKTSSLKVNQRSEKIKREEKIREKFEKEGEKGKGRRGKKRGRKRKEEEGRRRKTKEVRKEGRGKE